MSDFMQEPYLILHTQADVAAALRDTSWMKLPYPQSYRIKSVWLISLIDEIEASGKFPYNADVLEMAENRLGMPPRPKRSDYSQEGSPLSQLIYNAQQYHHSDRLRTNGFVPLTADLVEKLGAGARLLTKGGQTLVIKKIHDQLYAMEPRKRKYAVSLQQDYPVKAI